MSRATFDTHSLRRTKAVLIHRRNGSLRAVQLLLGPSKIECEVLDIEVDDAIEIDEKIDICCLRRHLGKPTWPAMASASLANDAAVAAHVSEPHWRSTPSKSARSAAPAHDPNRSHHSNRQHDPGGQSMPVGVSG